MGEGAWEDGWGFPLSVKGSEGKQGIGSASESRLCRVTWEKSLSFMDEMDIITRLPSRFVSCLEMRRSW